MPDFKKLNNFAIERSFEELARKYNLPKDGFIQIMTATDEENKKYQEEFFELKKRNYKTLLNEEQGTIQEELVNQIEDQNRKINSLTEEISTLNMKLNTNSDMMHDLIQVLKKLNATMENR